jgi:outer membrane protein TolC
MARSDAAARARDADALALDTDFQVAVEFYEFVRASEVERVLRNDRTAVERMRDIARVRYATGTAGQQDVLKIELTISQIDDDLAMNNHARHRARARLNGLIGRDPRAPLPDPVWEVPQAHMVEAMAEPESALVNSPEIAAARADIERAEAARTLAGREFIPDFMLGVKFEYGAGYDNSWELLAGVNLPIWLGKRRAMVRQTDAMREAARHQLDAEELRVRSELEDAMHGVYDAGQRVERFETLILPQAEQTLHSSEAGYRAGDADFMDLLDSQRLLLEMRKEYYSAIAILGVQLAGLERAMGGGDN